MWLRNLIKPLKRIWYSKSRGGGRVIAMNDLEPECEESATPPVKRKLEREFDFKRYAKRHIALMISYLGWNYHGLVIQPNAEDTVEAALVDALIKTKLIESIETANFKRCGRTDKGVSAFRQVVSLDVRSVASGGEGVFIPEGYSPYYGKKPGKSSDSADIEINYDTILNRVLPVDIRVLAWAPVTREFSARYQCIARTYKYFLPRGGLNLEAMRTASQLLVGTHDFRNFCKLDLPKNYISGTVRTINSVSIEEIDPSSSGDDDYDMAVLIINGSAFLWHQIRHIVTVLVLVGRGKENPDIITKLLDVEACPNRPLYPPSKDVPLVLYDCQFENIQWRWNKDSRSNTIFQLQRQWMELAAKAEIVKSMCVDLCNETASDDPKFVSPAGQVVSLAPIGRRKYIPLLKLPTGRTIEEQQAVHEMKKAKKEREKCTSPISMKSSD